MPQSTEALAKRLYAAPKLLALGAIKDVTTGSINVNGDGGTTRKKKGT